MAISGWVAKLLTLVSNIVRSRTGGSVGTVCDLVHFEVLLRSVVVAGLTSTCDRVHDL